MKNQFVVSAAAASAFVLLSSPAMAQDRGTISKNEFNPALSLILDGGLSVYSNDEDYEIAGFPLGGEAGPADEGSR